MEPLERRDEGVEDEEETPEAPAMLWVEGEAGGRRWDSELEEFGDKSSWSMASFKTRSDCQSKSDLIWTDVFHMRQAVFGQTDCNHP